MSLGRAVPWGSWEEWRSTGHLLLSGVPADVQQGLERVSGSVAAAMKTPCMPQQPPVYTKLACAAAAAAAAAAATEHSPLPLSPLQVAAWRARGRVPLGVDSTACLVEAQQRDAAAAAAPHQQQQGQQQPALASESELRLQYAMVVVRMVNGIADSSQRGRVAASVASLASAAGQETNSNGRLCLCCVSADSAF